jgi:predicted HAD superfamily phosphohydrolase YqeG
LFLLYGQSLSLDVTVYFPFSRFVNKSLAIPYYLVKDFSNIYLFELKNIEFKGLLFDKDNTLTGSYVNEIYSSIKSVFTKM